MKKLTIEYRVVIGFTIALTLLLLAGGQLYSSLHEYIATSRWVTHTYQVLEVLSDVGSSLSELESGQRGYIISGEERFITGHAREAERIRLLLKQIKTLTADNPRQQLRCTTLVKLTEECLFALNARNTLYRTEGFEASRVRMKSDTYRSGRDELLKLLTTMEEDERILLKQRSEQAEHNATQAEGIGTILVTITLAGLFLLWWRTRHEVRNQHTSEAVAHESMLMRQIIDLLPVGVFVAATTGAFTQINPAARTIWNGESPGDAPLFGDYAGWWPKSGKRLTDDEWALTRSLKGGESIRDELVDIRCFDGSRKTISVNAMPIRDESGHITSCLSVIIDVTGFKRTERQLRATARFDETQQRAMALFSASFDKTKILDGLLELLAELHPLPVSALYGFNPSKGCFQCEAAYGLSAEAPREFTPGEGLLGQAAQMWKTTLLDCKELTLQTGLFDFLPVQVLMIPISYQERRLAVLVLATSSTLEECDLVFFDRLASTLGVTLDNLRQYSDLLLLAQQLQESSEEIAGNNLKLEEVSRSKSEFLANMSHELRTPLNSVIGFSEVLQDQIFGSLNEKQEEYIKNILTSGRHLLSLINDILDLSKVESGKMELELSTFSLRETLDASVMMLQEKALKGTIGLSTELAPDADTCIVADQRKIKQILFNLVSNAVKFTGSGGVVNVSAVKDGEYIEITVADTGLGIKPEDIPKLFQAFTQLESVYTKGFEGTGLGLALTRQLVELHGGRIWVESTFGLGSRFIFTLPFTQTSTERSADSQPNIITGGGNIVLLIENDPLTQTSLKYALQNKGYRVLRANNGIDGIEMAKRESPDLIVLDLMMAGVNGFEVANRLQQDSATQNVPILVLTAMDLSTTDRARLTGKVWRIAEKGSLSTRNFISLVESAIHL